MAQLVSHEMRSMHEEATQPHSTAPRVPKATHEPTTTSRTTSTTAHEPVIRYLHTSLWPLIILAAYIALNLFAWIVFCIASTRLAGTRQEMSAYVRDPSYLVTKHENFIKAAQIVQAIASLLTIPLTSAICSIALVAFIQTGSLRTKLNLRQTMALADQGWISPQIWTRLPKVGSLPLYFTFGLTLTGASFQIVQQSLVQPKSARLPSRWTTSRNMRVPDIPMLLNEGNSFRATAVVRLRSVLESANEDEYQPYLWSKDNNDEWCNDSMTGCFHGQNDRTLNQLSRAAYHETDSRLWMTPLTSDFSSGVYPEPQYAPRVNTTVTYTNITAGEWPSGCAREREGIFFAEYNQQLEYPRVGLVICMPTNISSSPWDATHNRQDIIEELYINISTHPSGKGFYKATAKTSLGYFEIPSTHNGFIAGPLLDQVILPNQDKYSRRTRNLERRETNDTYVGNITQELGSNIGPLTTVALALFGEGSFIDTRLRNPSAYAIRERPDTGITDDGTYTDEGYSYNCISSTPLAFLSKTPGMGCWDDRQLSSERGVIFQVERFISLFAGEARTQAALTAGAFLANKAWLAPDGSSRLRQDISRTILVDHGVPTIKISLSMAGIIIGSVLLGTHLLGLLALALYAFVQKPFVPWLGAEIMVKAGMAYAEILGAAEGEQQWNNAAATCKGFVGDEKVGNEVGRVAFGAPAGLTTKKGKKFEGL